MVEVHIYLGTTYPDCSEDSYNSIALNESQPSYTAQAKNGQQALQLQFAPSVLVEHYLKVSPNPFQSDIVVSLPSEATGSLQLVDLLGKSLGRWKAIPGNSTIDLSSLTNGAYQLIWRALECTESITILKSLSLIHI